MSEEKYIGDNTTFIVIDDPLTPDSPVNKERLVEWLNESFADRLKPKKKKWYESYLNKIKGWYWLGYCAACGNWFKYPKKFHTGTAYLDRERNWGFACNECAKHEKERVREMWDEYYRSVL